MKKWTPNREKMIEDGFFDGRYIPKVVPDKKKESEKNKCRKKVDINNI